MPVPVRNSAAAAKKLVMMSGAKMLGELRQFALAVAVEKLQDAESSTIHCECD